MPQTVMINEDQRITSIKIPKISKAMEDKLTGKTVAIVDGMVVASGNNSFEVAEISMKEGYSSEEIMTAFIMGKKNYAI